MRLFWSWCSRLLYPGRCSGSPCDQKSASLGLWCVPQAQRTAEKTRASRCWRRGPRRQTSQTEASGDCSAWLVSHLRPWRHSMLRNYSICRGRSIRTSRQQSSYGILWNICQLTLAPVNTWPDPCTHYRKLDHRREVYKSLLLQHSDRGRERWLEQKLKGAFCQSTQAEWVSWQAFKAWFF